MIRRWRRWLGDDESAPLGPLIDTPYDTSTTNAGWFDESRRVLAPLAPGDALLFHPAWPTAAAPIAPTARAA